MKSATPRKLITTEQAREGFIQRGETVSGFARKHGLSPNAVFHVLYGTSKGRSGASHRAAVLLGVKEGSV